MSLGPLNRTYPAVVGQPQSVSLPRAYKSAVLCNNSGHYALVRVGGLDAPITPASASHIIPPYTIAGLNLSGQYLAVAWIDNVSGVGGLAASFSTGFDGVCDVTYNSYTITEYMTALPGATQATITPPVSPAGVWLRTNNGVNDFVVPAGNTLQIVGSDTLVTLVRCVRVMFGEESVATGNVVVYRAASLNPTVSLEVFAVGQVGDFLTVRSFLPVIEWCPSPGAEITLPKTQFIYCNITTSISTVLLYAEYRNP